MENVSDYDASNYTSINNDQLGTYECIELAIIVFGLMGNFISFLLFAFTKLKRCSSMLATLTIFDNAFLFLFLAINSQYTNKTLIKQFEKCFIYGFEFLANWFLVFCTTQQLKLFKFGAKKPQLLAALVSLSLATFVFYGSLVNYLVFFKYDKFLLLDHESEYNGQNSFALFVLFFSMFLPLLLNSTLIVFNLVKSKGLKTFKHLGSILFRREIIATPDDIEKADEAVRLNDFNESMEQEFERERNDDKYKDIMVMAVSIVFVLLSIPFALYRIVYYFYSPELFAADALHCKEDDNSFYCFFQRNDQILLKIALGIYLLGFSVKFLVYFCVSCRFRDVLLRRKYEENEDDSLTNFVRS